MRKLIFTMTLFLFISVTYVSADELVYTSETDFLESVETSSIVDNSKDNNEIESVEDESGIFTPILVDYNKIPSKNKSSDSSFDLSVDENLVRTNNRSGLKVLTVNQNDATLYIGNDMRLYASEPNTYSNEVVVKDRRIIKADKAIVTTIGGYEETSYIYSSLDDAVTETGGIKVSGGAFDGDYIDTINYNDAYYFHVYFDGAEGYMNINDAQIIPIEYVKSTSYYENINGDWYYFSAIDPVNSYEYQEMIVGAAPSWAIAGQKYYTQDDYNFYTDINLTHSIRGNSNLRTYNYFQELPFRSSSNYTGIQYKNYLTNVGATDSQYYNSTNAFVDAQDLKQLNSLLLFAFANHESAYGKSEYAKNCNNFFGRNAFDSSPDNACTDVGFNTPRDGILAEADFLNNNYFDVSFSIYNGDHFGNKSSGMNVAYASDPDWGKLNASHAYSIDEKLGGLENDLYRIIKVPSYTQVYKDSGFKSRLKIISYWNEVLNYKFYMHGGSGSANTIVTEEGSNYYRVQLPTQVNLGPSTVCKWTSANKGSYPEYDGYIIDYINIGDSYFGCDYLSFNAQEYYIPKSGTVSLNNNNIISPADYDSMPDFCGTLSNTSVTQWGTIYTFTSSNGQCDYQITNGIITNIDYKHYYSGTTTLQSREVQHITSSGFNYQDDFYTYYSNGKLKGTTITKFYGNGKASYKNNKTYSSSGVLTKDDYYRYHTSSKLAASTTQSFYSNGLPSGKTNTSFNESGIKYKQEMFTYYETGKEKATTKTNLYANGNVSWKNNRNYYSSGIIYKNDYYTYYENGSRKATTVQTYNSTNNLIAKRNYFQNVYGTFTGDDYYTYYDDGKLKAYTKLTFNSSGTITSKHNKTYYENGKVASDKIYYY